MMMTVIARKIPVLRFPEFEGEWVKLKIKEVGEIRSGSTPLRSKKQYFQDGLISWVKTTDLNNSYIYQTEENVTQRALKETSLKLFAPGSVLVAMYGGFNQIGRTGLLKVEAATNQALSVISVNELVIPEYLLIWFNAKVRLWKRFAGSSRKDPNITGSDVANFPVWLPPKVEQQKIATFLTTIDTRIQQLSRKKALLEQYKKGVMQQLFSQEIRFKDEDGKEFPAWEMEEFGKIAKKSKEKYDPSKSSETFPCIELESLSQGTGILLEFFDSKNQKSIKNKFRTGEVLFGKLRPYLRKFLIAPFEGVCSSEIWVLIGTAITNDFLYWMVQTDKFSYATSITSGSKMPRADWDYISGSPFRYPSKKEQQKIAAFLSTIDRQINLVSQQLERMQTFKKGLLQQMFV